MITEAHQLFSGEGIASLCSAVSSARPRLEKLAIQAPPVIPIPPTMLQDFDYLLCADLRMDLAGMSSYDSLTQQLG